jgi:hypothetical protein
MTREGFADDGTMVVGALKSKHQERMHESIRMRDSDSER